MKNFMKILFWPLIILWKILAVFLYGFLFFGVAFLLAIFKLAGETSHGYRIRYQLFDSKKLTGPAGFEPANAAVKVLCLTAWRWPTIKGGQRDSNPRPPEPQSGALTNCAIPTINQKLYLYFERSNILRSKQVMGIEPTYSAWKADVLPLNHTCMLRVILRTNLGRFERPTPALEGRCSIQLSYRLTQPLLHKSG